MTVDPRYGDDGLVLAIVQDAADGRVLMLAWMNEEALNATVATGEVHFTLDRATRSGERVRRAATCSASLTSLRIAIGTRSWSPLIRSDRRAIADRGAASIPRAPADSTTQGFGWLETLWAMIAGTRGNAA